ncbi:MAG: cytosine deaminase, partial [Firmicutes bacterium]|nr:cytosine deaminase [Bacillota bacterium]
MLYKNAYIENSEQLSDLRVEGGKFTEIGSSLEAKAGEEVCDLGGKLVLPPFIESHVHLDATLTAGDPVWNMSGTLFEGIA